MHTTRRFGSLRSIIVVLFAFALVVAACSSGGWQEMPKPPIEAPAEMGSPIAVVPIDGGTRTVVVSTSGSWVFEAASGFVTLEASPSVDTDAQVRSSSSGATMCDPASRSAWVLVDRKWEPLLTPRWLGDREGASVCQTPTVLVIW